MAQVIDFTLVMVSLTMPAALTPRLGPLQTTVLIFSALAALTYRLLGDGISNGAGLGKRLLGIYVADAVTRRPCTVKQAFLRMLYQWIPLFMMIDAIVLVCDGRQRWGDRTANTYVLLRHPKPPRSHANCGPSILRRSGSC